MKEGRCYSMLANFLALFNGLDIKYIYMAVGILILAGAISFIKRAVKLGATIMILALLLSYGGNYVHDFQQKYNIHITKDTVSMRVDGKDYSISLNNIERVEYTMAGTGVFNVDVYYKDNTDKTSKATFKVPTYMLEVIKQQVKKLGVEAVEK